MTKGLQERYVAAYSYINDRGLFFDVNIESIEIMDRYIHISSLYIFNHVYIDEDISLSFDYLNDCVLERIVSYMEEIVSSF